MHRTLWKCCSGEQRIRDKHIEANYLQICICKFEQVSMAQSSWMYSFSSFKCFNSVEREFDVLSAFLCDPPPSSGPFSEIDWSRWFLGTDFMLHQLYKYIAALGDWWPKTTVFWESTTMLVRVSLPCVKGIVE